MVKYLRYFGLFYACNPYIYCITQRMLLNFNFLLMFIYIILVTKVLPLRLFSLEHLNTSFKKFSNFAPKENFSKSKPHKYYADIVPSWPSAFQIIK